MKKQDKKINPTNTKLKYLKPGVLTEDVFETMALSCGKDSGPACAFAPPNS